MAGGQSGGSDGKPDGRQGGGSDCRADGCPIPINAGGIAFKDARKTASFRLIVAAEALWGLAIIPAVAVMPAHLSDKGLSPLFVSGTAMACMFAVSAASKLLAGVVSDRLGPAAMVVSISAAGTAATLLLALADGEKGAVACAVFMGMAFSCMTMPIPLLSGAIFGERAIAELSGFFSAVLTLFGAAGAPLCNLAYDRLGTYAPAFAAQAAFFAAAAAAGALALKLRPRIGATWPQGGRAGR
jgi:MFS family permease